MKIHDASPFEELCLSSARLAPRSHHLGRIAESDMPRVVAACGVAACLNGEDTPNPRS
jgi:hypothetical protein